MELDGAAFDGLNIWVTSSDGSVYKIYNSVFTGVFSVTRGHF